MKYLIVLLLFSYEYSFACINWISESELIKAIALEPGAGKNPCTEAERCYCFDGMPGPWEVVSFVDGKIVLDPAKKAIYDQKKAETEAAKLLKEQEKAAAKSRLKNTELSSSSEIKQAVIDLINVLSLK